MEEYEREWMTRQGLPRQSHQRIGLTKRAGVPVRFLVQLEYRLGGTWRPVARFDHDVFGPAYRNVEHVGLHLDIYDPDGRQIEKRTTWKPQPATDAMGAAEEYLRTNAERLVRRFKT